MRFLVFITCVICLVSCSSPSVKKSAPTTKTSANDPFAKTMVLSQYFEVSGNKNEIIESREHIRLFTQAGTFVNEEGQAVEGTVKVELAEALSLDDMVLSNLTTVSNGKLLQSDGMFYFHFSSEGKEVFINPEKPIYVEVPVQKKVAGMQLYLGQRDSIGNINWTNPRPLENYLITFDFEVLNFYPEGFEEAVRQGMPFRGHLNADRAFTDSLYFHLQPPYRYDNSDDISDSHGESEGNNCGINPREIQALQSMQFSNTYIATREFEKRLQVLFKTCRSDLLQIYIKYLDKELWQADSVVAQTLGTSSEWYQTFMDFAAARETNVQHTPGSLAGLADFYNNKLKELEQELNQKIEKVQQAESQKEAEYKAVVAEYQALVVKRESYRMSSYGFTLTTAGWVNIDVGLMPKPWEYRNLNVEIANTEEFDEIHTYLFMGSTKSLLKLGTADNKMFTNTENNLTPVTKNSIIYIVAVAYKNMEVYFHFQEYYDLSKTVTTITLQLSSMPKVQETLAKALPQSNEASSISLDLEYMKKMAQERQRKKEQQAETLFLQNLAYIAFSCCNEEQAGAVLFNSYCRSCHSISEQVVGPPLCPALRKHSMNWLIRFTRNPQAMIRQGDPEAVRIYKTYNQSIMPAFKLDDKSIRNIYSYIALECTAK